jgi:hypothetical protein
MIEVGDLVRYKDQHKERHKGVWLVVNRWQSNSKNVGLELTRRAKGRWARRLAHPSHLEKI